MIVLVEFAFGVANPAFGEERNRGIFFGGGGVCNAETCDKSTLNKLDNGLKILLRCETATLTS